MNKKDAVEFAKQFKWTEADAKRAYADLDLKDSVEQDLMLALVKFAGPELVNRQNLQKAQKAQVTKKKNHIEKIEIEFEEKVDQYEEMLQKERSAFVAIVGRIYAIAKIFGMKDLWIENMLLEYKEYQSNLDMNTDSSPGLDEKIDSDEISNPDLDLDEPA